MTSPRKALLSVAATVVAGLLGCVVFWPFFHVAEPFMPHGHCYLWQPGLIWTHVISDVLIGLSYVAISSTLVYMVYRARRDLPFHWMVAAFGVFIVACGTTHFVEAWTIWHPVYWFAALIKVITAVASLGTAILLPPLVPRVVALLEADRLSRQRQQELEQEVQTRLAAERELRKMQETLEQRVRQRTSSLSQANSALTFYETIFKTSAWGVAVVDSVRGLIQMANPAFARMHGYEPDEMTGMPLAATFAPEVATDLPPFGDLLQAHDHLLYETVHQRKDQTRFACLTDVTLVRDPEGLPLYRFGYFRDISEQKRIEEDIRSVITHARCILWRATAQGEGDWQTEGKGKFVWDLKVQDEIAAQHFQALYVPEGSTYSEAWRQSRVPEDARAAAQIAERAFRRGSASYSHESRAYDKFGSLIWLHEDVSVVPLGPGRWQCIGVCTDVTEQQQLNEQLQQHAELLELSHDAIVVRGQDGEILFWNRGAEELYGWPRAQALGRNIHKLLSTEIPEAEFIAALESRGYWVGQLRHRARDGREVIVDSRHLLVRRADGSTVVLETNHDITGRESLASAYG